MDDERYQKLKDFALRFLSFRPRSHKEIRGRLMQFSIKKGIPAKMVEDVIGNLITQGLINDEEFVKWWIEQRRLFRQKGMKAIKMELLQKGVSRETIERITSTATNNKNDEYNLALQVTKKKLPLYRHLSKEKIKIRISSLLARRGFDWNIIYKVIDSLVKKS